MPVKYSAIAAVAQEAGVVLSLVAMVRLPERPEHAFNAGAVLLREAELPFVATSDLRLDRVSDALDRLNQLAPLAKPQLIKAATAVAFVDGQTNWKAASCTADDLHGARRAIATSGGVGRSRLSAARAFPLPKVAERTPGRSERGQEEGVILQRQTSPSSAATPATRGNHAEDDCAGAQRPQAGRAVARECEADQWQHDRQQQRGHGNLQCKFLPGKHRWAR